MEKTKIVNLYCGAPIRIDKINYSGTVTKVEMPIETIRKCLLNHIRVEEVKPNGKVIPLGFDNYDKDTDLVEEPKPIYTYKNRKIPEYKIFSYDKKGNKITPPEYKEVNVKKEEPKEEVQVQEETKPQSKEQQQKYTKRK